MPIIFLQGVPNNIRILKIILLDTYYFVCSLFFYIIQHRQTCICILSYIFCEHYLFVLILLSCNETAHPLLKNCMNATQLFAGTFTIRPQHHRHILYIYWGLLSVNVSFWLYLLQLVHLLLYYVFSLLNYFLWYQPIIKDYTYCT